MTSLEQRSYAVIDTNVVLDWLVFQDPGCDALVATLEAGALFWLLTTAMKEECEHVLRRPAFGARHRRAFDAAARLARTVGVACRQCGQLELRCTDPDDQKFVDLALWSGAQWLFTRDNALLKLARRASRRGIEILTPAAWAMNREKGGQGRP